MKVCTDACILGAWTAAKINAGKIVPSHILDIGCGTGLLSLMIAQAGKGKIDAVEINEAAFVQAKENIALSPWQQNIAVHHTAINDFIAPEKYDLIICNPPFYENDLKSGDAEKDAAMHATMLSFEALAAALKNNLAAGGKAAVLLPFHRTAGFITALQKEKLFVSERLNIAHSPKHNYFRSVLIIGFEETTPYESSLFIRNEENIYSEAFQKLMEAYYL